MIKLRLLAITQMLFLLLSFCCFELMSLAAVFIKFNGGQANILRVLDRNVLINGGSEDLRLGCGSNHQHHVICLGHVTICGKTFKRLYNK